MPKVLLLGNPAIADERDKWGIEGLEVVFEEDLGGDEETVKAAVIQMTEAEEVDLVLIDNGRGAGVWKAAWVRPVMISRTIVIFGHLPDLVLFSTYFAHGVFTWWPRDLVDASVGYFMRALN